MNFFECKSCKTLVYLLEKGGCTPSCCGEEMKEAAIHTSSEQTGSEKHVPIVHEENGKVYVKVGEVPHPMLENHYIDWIFLVTDKGTQRKNLHPNVAPEALFQIGEDEIVIAVYAHCNLHGLWKADL